MQETPEQYSERIISYQQGMEPVSVLSTSLKKLSRLIKGASKRTLTARPEPDRWSAAEILAHLADAELVFGFRLRLILGSNGTAVQAYDQDRWSEFSQYPRQDPRVSLQAFEAQRQRNIDLLRTIEPEMWEYYGMHEERGRESITRLAQLTAGHDINHLRQIEEIMRPAKAKKAANKRR